MGKPFSPEHDRWLLENHDPDRTVRQLTAMFNRHFGENRSKDTIKHHLKRLGLHQTRRNFTEEEDRWLMENAPFLSVRETAKQFNEKFGTNRSEEVLKVRCNRSLNTYHANCKFGLGYPIGTETTHSGYIWVKILDIPGVNSFYRNWKPKHQIVWENRYGTLPEGKTIIFLDRNHENCDIDNLYAVDGRTLREMSKKKWWSKNRELTLAAIKWCELFYVMKDFGR